MKAAPHSLEQALALAYRHLNRRERTVSEMRAHLLAKGLEPVVVDAAVQELAELGYLDDARFARLFAQDKRELVGWGAERIRRELLGRGVERELALQAARGETASEVTAAGTDGELDRALAVLRRRFPAAPRERRERDRALGVLLRKGYDYELALEALAAQRRE